MKYETRKELEKIPITNERYSPYFRSLIRDALSTEHPKQGDKEKARRRRQSFVKKSKIYSALPDGKWKLA